MMRLWLCVLCVFSSAASAADVVSDNQTQSDQPTVWLDKMADAMQHMNYDMSLVVLQPGGGAEPYRWRHGLVNGTAVEHLSMLNGPGRDVVRLGDIVSYFEPNVPAFSLRSEVINGPLPGTLLHHPEQLHDSYDFVLVGRSRIAGRATQQIRIISRDKSRYGFSLWLDQETALPLKMDMLDNQGNVLEQVQITSVHVSPEPEESLAQIQADELPPVVNLAEKQFSHPWFAGWLPDGMVEMKRDRHRLQITGAPVDYLLFSDGLIDVSIYIQPMPDSGEATQAFRFGSDTYFSTQVGQLLITIVGKLPPQTADKIAQSIVAKVPAP